MEQPHSDQLWYSELNGQAVNTIVLLHGLGTSHLEWSAVETHLSDYHVLVPDLPGHSNSAHLTSLDVSSQANYVASLIREHAHQGRAHLVGLSMGGFVALETAHAHPDVALSVFASGCAPFKGLRHTLASNPAVVGVARSAYNMLPRWLINSLDSASWKWQGLTVTDEMRTDFERNSWPRLVKVVFESLSMVQLDHHAQVQVRSLAVAGGRMDDVKSTTSQGVALRHGCSDSRAVVVKDAFHPWNLQFPELFAQGIKCWAERRALPAEFVELKEGGK